MASTLPSNALANLANSIKNVVAQPGGDDTAVPKQDASSHEEIVDNATTVHKDEVPTVEHEVVKPHEHEKIETVVDKEVHQDHYHRTVQPVKDKKVLPTKHTYKENEAEREFDHREDSAVKALQQEGSKFHDEKEVEATNRTEETVPTKVGEHIHHHIHETVQPVIEREIIQPEVVHTTNHVHETHHLNAEHHATTTAPAITLADYEKKDQAQTGVHATKNLKEEPKGVKPAPGSATNVGGKLD